MTFSFVLIFSIVLTICVFVKSIESSGSNFELRPNGEFRLLNQLQNSANGQLFSTVRVLKNLSTINDVPFATLSTLRLPDYSNSTVENLITTSEPLLLSLKETQISSHLYSRGKIDECWKEAKCEPLEDSNCLGVKLPYMHTSLALSSLTSQRASREVLDHLSTMRNLPHCWSVVQPFLCAVLFPECHNSSVQLPSQEMCAITRGPCRLMEQERGWPEFLKCREEFPPKCKISTRDLQFNTTGHCSPPLLNTSNENQWYEGIRGCGVQCSDPLFTEEEHKSLQDWIAVLGGFCLASSSLAVFTFLVDWESTNKYPAVIIFYINACYMIIGIGFIVQFFSNVKENITCHSDGTLRNSELSGGNWSCWIDFACVYYFTIAAWMWFIILGYAWHKKFKSLAGGSNLCQQNLKRNSSYFHLFSWSIPLVFTICIYAFSEVKADSAFGICFLSPSIAVRVGALLLPITCAVFIGGFFLLSGLNTLVRMKLECSNIISDHANKKIVKTIVRFGIFTLTLVIFLIISIYCHTYGFLNQNNWKESLRKYILCVSMNSDSSTCRLASRPKVNLYILQLIALFGSGIIMASWCWTKNSYEIWRRYFRKIIGAGRDEPVKISKHKIIAQAFAKRNNFNAVGRLSISLCSLHSDPLGLNFEMNSDTSGDVSSVWAAAIPYLMNRRGAVSGSSAFIFRRNSIDSLYSIGRRASLESTFHQQRHSRRHSLDSQMSFHVSDVERLAALKTAAHFGGKRRRDWFSLRNKRKKGQVFESRNSYTSDESNMGSMILPAVTVGSNDSLFTTMMKRLSLSGELQSPSLQKNGMISNVDSEDENTGGRSFPSHRHGKITRSMLHNEEFYRKFNGFRKKGKSKENDFRRFEKERTHNVCETVAKASVGIQTSLESLIGTERGLTEDKSCQVSTPLLRKSITQQNSSTPSGSTTSLSESVKLNGVLAPPSVITETSFISNQNNNSAGALLGHSLNSVPLTSKKVNQSSKTKHFKQRSSSENEKNYCILDLEELTYLNA